MSDKARRKLTTILAADAEGYSREMETDEVRALGSLHAARRIFATSIERHDGRIANTAGDGLIAEFPSVVEAVQCAVEVQRELAASPECGLRFRIGLHLGDVFVDGDDLLGEGVNLAARLQTMAEPGGILISRQVHDHVHSKISVGFESLGETVPRNFSHNVHIYRVSSGGAAREPHFRRWPGPESGSDASARPERPHDPAAPAASTALRERIIRRARQFGIGWLILLALDIATGGGPWAIWPGIALLVALGLEAAPLFARERFPVTFVRAGVVILGLALINLTTWNGGLWFLLPAAAIVAVVVLRRRRALRPD
ncbi:MAG: adenylate/guanylate cyclase domain-containing protein [Acuticoccus sp.]